MLIIGDNFIVWVRDSKLISGRKYSAYIQYFEPSFAYVYTDDYMITKGSNYVLDYNYTNSQFSSYISSADISYSYDTMYVDDSYYSDLGYFRADSVSIFVGQFICVVCFLWIFKQFSRLFFKGGLW